MRICCIALLIEAGASSKWNDLFSGNEVTVWSRKSLNIDICLYRALLVW